MPRFVGRYIDDDGVHQSAVFDAADKYKAKAIMAEHGAPQSLGFTAGDLVPFHDEQSEDATSASEDQAGEDAGTPVAGEGAEVSTANAPADPAADDPPASPV